MELVFTQCIFGCLRLKEKPFEWKCYWLHLDLDIFFQFSLITFSLYSFWVSWNMVKFEENSNEKWSINYLKIETFCESNCTCIFRIGKMKRSIFVFFRHLPYKIWWRSIRAFEVKTEYIKFAVRHMACGIHKNALLYHCAWSWFTEMRKKDVFKWVENKSIYEAVPIKNT